MKYKITKVTKEDQTVKVDVEYEVNGVYEKVTVPIFAPKTKEDVLEGIKNRGLTILAKLEHESNADKVVKELSVVVTKRTAIFYDTSENKLTFYDFVIEKGGSTTPNSYSPTLPDISPLENQLNHFLYCIKNNVKPISDDENGLEIVRVLESADESKKLNKEVNIIWD